MGKQKVLSEKDLHELVLPSANDVLGVVQKMLGFDSDGEVPERVHACLPYQGKMKRRTWIREWRHRRSQPMGLPERGTRRDILALHPELGRGTKEERNTEDRVG